MPISRDIARAYVKPRQVMADRLAAGQREDRALAYLMGACVLIFVAQWPRLRREAFLDPSINFEATMAGTLMAWIIVAPLLFYGIAAALHVSTRVFRGQGTWFTTRLALFWSLLALSPLMLLHGLTAGFIGPSPALSLVSALVLAGFLWLVGNAMIAAEKTSPVSS